LIHELGPKFRVFSPRALERLRIDNASVMARRVYLTDVELFDAVWLKEKRNLRSAIAQVIAIAKADEARKPFAALRKHLGLPPDSARKTAWMSLSRGAERRGN
jgi:hypothetical protein